MKFRLSTMFLLVVIVALIATLVVERASCQKKLNLAAQNTIEMVGKEGALTSALATATIGNAIYLNIDNLDKSTFEKRREFWLLQFIENLYSTEDLANENQERVVLFHAATSLLLLKIDNKMDFQEKILNIDSKAKYLQLASNEQGKLLSDFSDFLDRVFKEQDLIVKFRQQSDASENGR